VYREAVPSLRGRPINFGHKTRMLRIVRRNKPGLFGSCFGVDNTGL
jgi:hypothetical protein